MMHSVAVRRISMPVGPGSAGVFDEHVPGPLSPRLKVSRHDTAHARSSRSETPAARPLKSASHARGPERARLPARPEDADNTRVRARSNSREGAMRKLHDMMKAMLAATAWAAFAGAAQA